MNRVGTEHGILLALNFGADDLPRESELKKVFGDPADLDLPLDALLSIAATKPPGVRTMVLDVSPDRAGAAAVEKYLELKRKGRL